MSVYRFNMVEVLFAGDQKGQDEILLGGLVQAGFGKISRVTKPSECGAIFSQASPDLVILQSNETGDDLLELCWELRHSLIGRNPFATVLNWNSKPTEPIVKKSAECGVDALISDSPSAPRIVGHVTRSIWNRNPFVVTSDYIGPDRRQGRAGDDDDEMARIDVPNALKAKATGDKAAIRSLESDIAASIRAVNEQKLTRHVEQIAYLVAMIEWICQDTTAGKAIDAHLKSLIAISADLPRRIRDDLRDTVAILCLSLHNVVHHMRNAELGPDGVHLEQLRTITREIAQACRPALSGQSSTPEASNAGMDFIDLSQIEDPRAL